MFEDRTGQVARLTRERLRRAALMVLAAGFVAGTLGVRLGAQDRFLGKADILLFGFGLRVEPSHQVVPKNIATIVSAFLSAANPPGTAPAFAPDAIVKATLFGPAYPNGLALTAAPNAPITIPPIALQGTYTLADIRLESGGDVLMRGIPDAVTIDVIDKLLVTQVTARALTAQEIRDKGIVFDKSSFQAYNFTAAFAVQDTPVQISFPVVLPSLQGAQGATVSSVDLSSVPGARLPQLQTIIPDTLKLQTQIPNLQVVGFTLSVPSLQGKQLVVPPIPGVVVIPGDIGFLDQFFSVMLMVGNVAPQGSNLVVSDLTGEILLPPGNDGIVGTDDDPLRMATTAKGESPKIQPVAQPGPDGKLGTADDIPTIGPGESASAEYLVEGRREGTSTIEFNITGTLHGLPVGPVTVTGRAVGSVLVRNPNFTLTFTHPSTVTAGEKYSLDVTVTNTSTSPANFVTVNLFSQNITGATLVGDSVRSIDSIAPADSATVSFDLIARVTGTVTAATLDSDDKVEGRFALKTAVGDLGVPLSPDSLVLPNEAAALPTDLRTAVLGLLGKAWAVATAPPAALPNDVQRFSKQIVYDRAVQAAEAGVRIGLHEPVPDSAAQLEMDFVGSDFSRLPALHPDPTDLQFTQTDFSGFDSLRRRSVRGDVLATAVGALLAPELAGAGAAAFHQSFAEKVSYRPPHISVVVSRADGPLPFDATLVDAQGRRLGGADSTGKVVKDIPFSDRLPFTDGSGAVTGEMFVLAAPDPGQYHLQFSPVAGAVDAPFTVSIVVPDGAGGLRQVVYDGLTGSSAPTSTFAASDPYQVLIDLPTGGASTAVVPTSDAPVAAPLPHVLGVVQQADKDVDADGNQLGRIIAVLFDQEITPASAQDGVAATSITNYAVDDNAVVGVALQPGHRIAFLALRDPVGPFVARQLTVSGVVDGRGRSMDTSTMPIETTVTRTAAVVSGQVINADGTPVPSASVRLFVTGPSGSFGLSSKSADAAGRYSWDWVPATAQDRIVAVNPATDDSRTLDFTVQRNGQRLNIDVVFLGRGTLTGRTLSEAGVPLANSNVAVTSLTDQSQYGATTDEQGRFTIGHVPVGNILIQGVNVAAHAQGTASELIPVAGGVVTRDVTLFDVSAPTIVATLGNVTGHVLRGDGATVVTDVPVIAYYESGTQAGVFCPNPTDTECAVMVARTDASGAFTLANVTAGQLRLVSLEQSSFQQGEARVTVPPNGAIDVTILFAQGLGTVAGLVVDASGQPVAGARVGGGLSLTTSDATGRFTLTDVPIGHRDIVAVSDQLGTKGTATVDLPQPGQVVNVTVVLAGTATIAGTVFQADGSTPVPNNKVFLYYRGGDGIVVVATTVTDGAGRYSIPNVLLAPGGGTSPYEISAFRPDFSDGNVRIAALKFNGEVFRGDIVFRGGGGQVTGHVFDADGTTPLRAEVGLSGDQVVVAGGLVGTGFQTVANYQIADTDLSTGSFSFTNIFVGPFTLSAVGQFSPDPVTFDGRIPSPNAAVQVDLRLQATSQINGTVYLPDGVTPAGRDIVVRYQSSAFKQVCATSTTVTVGNIAVAPGECADVPQGIQNESAVTDDNGRFTLPLVNAGAFTLTASDPASGRTAQTSASIRPGQTGEFSVRLLGFGTLTINVRGSDSTTPIPGAKVDVKQLGFPNKTLSTVADGNGTVVLNGGDAFTEGDVVVLATDPRTGFAGRASGRISGDGNQVTIPVYLFNAAGSALGVVRMPDGITPVPNAEVVISHCVADAPAPGVPCPSTALAFDVTDANGSYTQNQIPLGGFTVEVYDAATARHGFASGRIDFDRQQVPLDVTEAGRGLVTGTALTAGTLAPLKDWDVVLRQISPSGRLFELQAASDVDGSFAFPGVGVGDFQVTVRKFQSLVQPDLPFGSQTVADRLSSEGQHVDVPVIVQLNQKEYGRVEGVVFNADGTPAPNVSIAVCVNCGVEGSDPSLEQFTQTGADGSFAIDGVATGRFTILAKDQTSLNAVSGAGQLLFEGDVAHLTLTLVGLSQISGTVEFSNGQPVPTAKLTLYAQPSSGCQGGTCSLFTDATGHFTFSNVPGRTFWISATDAISGLSGTVSGTSNAGSTATVRIVLQPAAAVSGRVLSQEGRPAAGITAELDATSALSQLHLFQVSDQNGGFTFPTVPLGTYSLTLQDPIGPGIARQGVQVAGPVALGDISLRETPPAIVSTTPASSATSVPLGTQIRIAFSERVDAATITQANITIAGPSANVLGTLQLTDVDTTVLFTPLAPLVEKTRYTITVQNVADLVGKVMAPFSGSFVTVDLTPPSIVELAPAADGRGIALATTVRVRYSEPIDPTRYRGPPITLTEQRPNGSGGTDAIVVAGRTDFILGNTAVVFTPTLPLDPTVVYQVAVLAATDLSGNTQPQDLTYSFRTFDQTPPQVTALTPAGNGSVIENAVTQVVASVDTTHDIAVVDFFLNDQPALAARTAPFTLSFQATSALGKPGDQIKVSAQATDTSGNRSTVPAVVFVPIVADAPPAVGITTPAPNTAFRTGDRVTVTVHSTDDLGVTQVGFRAQTGNPQDASTVGVAPASRDTTRSFAFTIAPDAVPGSAITINASATDTKGQVASAAPVAVTILDATPPTVAITGTTSGARVAPGQQTSAIVLAQDLGGVASISFTTGGVLVGTQTSAVSPAQNSVAASFAFTVPASAHPGDTLTLDATATDAAGNVGSAARILLPIADLNPPTLRLSTTTGSLDIVPGTTATLVLEAQDDTAVAAATVQGQGAFSFSAARQVSPPSNSVKLTFDVQVPATAPEGAKLNVSATASDVFGNVSVPATLTLSVRSSQTVTLPPSAIVAAGDTSNVTVQLDTPAGPGGVLVDFLTDDPRIAQADPSVQFAEGESSKSITITGVSGGVTSLTALINGVPRAAMTVTVSGGIVSGVVLNDSLQPVPGATVAVSSVGGFVISTAVADGNGHYSVEGVGSGSSTSFTVKASDPVTHFIGFSSGSLNVPGGFARVTVVLVSAGSIGGSVVLADGRTTAPAGARVDLIDAADTSAPAATTFTDTTGAYEFPIVSIGTYYVEASDTAGNRGISSSVALTAAGQQLTVVVAYLGRGTITGTVRNSSLQPIGNIPVSLSATSLFGTAPTVRTSAAPDGTFRFDNVFAGSVTVQANDPVSNLAGTTSATIDHDGQVVSADIILAPWSGLEGVVYRSDGVTPVPNTPVTLRAGTVSMSATTDTNGRYVFSFVPLGSFSVEAREAATQGIGRASGTLSINGGLVTQDLVFLPQGSLAVTVVDGSGAPVAGAAVTVLSITATVIADPLFGTTDANGVALVEHVLAGPDVTVTAISNGLRGTATTPLQPNEVKALTVSLAATASVAGTVLLPDGQTPASGTVFACHFECAQQALNPDGTYRLDGLVLGSWRVSAVDVTGRTRAIAQDVELTASGQVATANLTFIGLGSVVGRVLNPDGSSAGNILVTVHALTPDFGGFVQPRTDAAGFYRADGVAVGSLTVSAGDVTRGLLGEAAGALGKDGDTLTLDILLQNNAITLPVTRTDANFFPYDVQRDATIASGWRTVFGAACCPLTTAGAGYLDLISAGTPYRFAGASIGTTEDFGRQVVISQNGLAGLNVTRKVLVPNAYFARYLEVLTNPTSAPITVDVRVQSNVQTAGVLATSSGDQVLSVADPTNPDRWVMFQEDDNDPFLVGGYPQVGFVFDGVGGTMHASIGEYDASPVGIAAGQLSYGWSNVTIQPGQTVEFMHFAVQQYSRAAAQASLDRLVQLPPEALEGLGPIDLTAIQNFAVSSGASASLVSLPPLGGSITGRVFEADGTTPVAAFDVRLRSSNIFFGRTYRVSADVTGTFTFAGPAVTVPIDAFTLQAVHPVTRVSSAVTGGIFAPGETTAHADIQFSDTGIAQGTVRRTSGQLVVGATITATAIPLNLFATFAASGSDGSYFATALPTGDVTVSALMRHPQGINGFSLVGTATIAVVAGQTVARDLIIQPTGVVTGTVRNALGAPATNVLTQLSGGSSGAFFVLQTRTDSSGVYRFADVPLGNATVLAFDPNTNFPASAAVAVTQDQATTMDLAFVGTGSVAVLAKLANGIPAAGAYVEVVRPAGVSAGLADANGRVTLGGVLPGLFIVRVHHPTPANAFGSVDVSVDVTGTISATGQIVNVVAVLPPVGTLVVQVTSGGAPVTNARVDTDVSVAGFVQTAGFTDANGNVTLLNAPGGRSIQATAYDPSGLSLAGATGAVTAEGQVATIPIQLDAIGTVAGHVTKNGGPAADVSVDIHASNGSYSRTVQAGPDGAYVFTGVPTGAFRVIVTAPIGVGSATGTLLHDGDNVTADLSLTGIALAASLTDANGFPYTVAGSGYIRGGAYAGFASLNVAQAAGNGSFFSGDTVAAAEMNGRQLVISNFANTATPLPIAGLTVTRKVYIDPSGYFARVLDILDNPAAAAAVVDVTLSGSFFATQILATSSGGTTPGVTDQWLMTDSAGAPTSSNAVVVFAGANAALQPAEVNTQNLGFAAIAWNSVIVPAGGRVALLHFEAQAANEAAGIAMADRLVQLPPEALAGLAPAEIGAIQNFAVPPDGSSVLPPFAEISGHVFAADGASPVPNVRVHVTGNSAPIFSASVTVSTDSSGRYVARTLAAGSVAVQAEDPGTGATTAVATLVSDGQTALTRDLMFTGTGLLAGTVRSAGGLPVSGAAVSVFNSTFTIFFQTFTGPDGRYRFGLLQPESYAVEASLNDGRNASASGISVASGQIATADLSLSPVATVRLTVTVSGTPLAHAHVYMNSNPAGDTDASGTVVIPSVGAGSFTLQVYAPDFSSVIASPTGVVRPQDDGTIIDLAVQVVVGSVSGTVFAGDGATAVANTLVEAFDAGSAAPIASTISDANGHYGFANLFVTGSFEIVAHGPAEYNSVTTTVTQTFGASGVLGLDLSVPLAVVHGTVLKADGATPVPNASLTLAQEDALGNIVTHTPPVDASGTFTAFTPAGAFDLEARDDLSWYAVRATGSADDLTVAQTITLVLPPLGRVTGTFVDLSGQPIPSAKVAIESARTDVGSSQLATTDANGVFTFDRVPAGAFSIQACAPTTAWVCANVNGAIATDQQSVNIDLALPATGSVSGTAYWNATTPAAFSSLVVTPANGGPLALNQRRFASTDASGHYTVADVTPGPVTITMLQYGQGIGLASGTVSPGTSATIDVVSGSAVACGLTLFDAANFEYDTTCFAELTGGGTADGRLSDAYNTAYTLRINGNSPTTGSAAQLELNGRQAVFGPFALSGVVMTRKLFVPSTGRFARYLDTLTNPSNAPITVEVQVESRLDGAIRLAVDPATTGDIYAVTFADPSTQFGTATTRPLLAHVFGALGAPVHADAVSFQRLLGTSRYHWTVSLAAGQTITFMHFAVPWDPADVTGAESQAQALAALTDRDALTGMTAAEKALVVNFIVP